jgi:hypothetical protein
MGGYEAKSAKGKKCMGRRPEEIRYKLPVAFIQDMA